MKVLKKDVKRDLISIRVLLSRAESMITSLLVKTNSDEVRELYRKVSGLVSKIDDI